MVRTAANLFGFLLCPLLLFSQNSAKDSLQSLLANNRDPKQILELSNQLAAQSKDASSIFLFAHNAYRIADELDHIPGQALSAFYLGKAYASQNMADSAEYFLSKSLRYARQLKDSTLLANTLLEKGRFQYYYAFDFNKAINRYTEALSIFRQQSDKEKTAHTLILLGKAYRRNGKNETATGCLEEACAIAQSLGNNKLMVSSWIDLANVFMNSGLFEKAVTPLKKAIKRIPESSKECRIAYNKMGISYNRLSRFDTALVVLNKLCTLSQESNDSTMHANALLNLGVAYNRMGNYSKALEVYDQSANIMSQLNNPKGLSSAYHNIGKIYKQLGDTAQAMASYERSLNIKLDIGDIEGAGRTYNNMANILSDEKNFEASLVYYFKAYDLHLASGNRRSQALTLANISEAYLLSEKYDKALEYGYSSLDIFQAINDKAGLSFIIETLAKIYLKLQDSPDDIQLENYGKKSIPEIEKMLLQASKLSEESQDFDYLIDSYYTLTEFYRNQNQPVKALRYQDKYIAAKDSFFSVEKLSAVAEMQTRFDTESKIQENNYLRETNQLIKSRNQTFLAVAIVLLLLLITSVFFYSKLRTAKTQLEQQHKTIENQNTTLTSLNKTKDRFFGIIAHDLKSPLIALQGLGSRIEFLLNRNDRKQLNELGQQVDQTSTKLNDLLDNLLSWASLQTGNIPYQPKKLNLLQLSEEVVFLFSNLIRINDLTVINSISLEVDVFADERALNTILRNLIGNAIKFTPANGTIELQSSVQKNEVKIQVLDNGMGIPPQRLNKLFASDKSSTPGARGEKGTGLGLTLCKELLEINKGSISVSSKVGVGSTFVFSLPKG